MEISEWHFLQWPNGAHWLTHWFISWKLTSHFVRDLHSPVFTLTDVVAWSLAVVTWPELAGLHFWRIILILGLCAWQTHNCLHTYSFSTLLGKFLCIPLPYIKSQTFQFQTKHMQNKYAYCLWFKLELGMGEGSEAKYQTNAFERRQKHREKALEWGWKSDNMDFVYKQVGMCISGVVPVLNFLYICNGKSQRDTWVFSCWVYKAPFG